MWGWGNVSLFCFEFLSYQNNFSLYFVRVSVYVIASWHMKHRTARCCEILGD